MTPNPYLPRFNGVVCKGSYALGSACGMCEKCAWEREQRGVMQDFVQQAIRTESRDFFGIRTRLELRLLHAGMGMATESGEFIDQLKKHLFYGKALDHVNLVEEMGDLLWYVAIACDELGVSLNDVQQRVINKLRQRYPDKFAEDKALNRNLDAERAVLEQEKEQSK